MFKRGSAAAFTLTVALAATHFGSPSGAGTPSQAVTDARQASSRGRAVRTSAIAGASAQETRDAETKSPYAGGCSAYELYAESGPHSAPIDENKGAAAKVIDGFFALDPKVDPPPPATVRYAIAIAPDPRHTNLGVMFDREMSLVVQAAQDQGYDYNSSWLPWHSESLASLDSLGERETEEELTGERENCPGVIFFRKRASQARPGPDPGSFKNGLVVFVVGEQATGGINQGQWKNAIVWLESHAKSFAELGAVPTDGKSGDSSGDGVLRILGPTFTGSLVSLQRNLADTYSARSESPLLRRFPSVRILSGGVSGCSAVHSFQANLPKPPAAGAGWHIDFGTFLENDSVHIYRFLEYLKDQGTRPSDTAILSEDETAYAARPTPSETAVDPLPNSDSCEFPYYQDDRPIHLVFPRDISALRNAYEKQAVFDTSKEGLKERSHTILRDEGSAEAAHSQITDTIATSSGSVAAVD